MVGEVSYTKDLFSHILTWTRLTTHPNAVQHGDDLKIGMANVINFLKIDCIVNACVLSRATLNYTMMVRTCFTTVHISVRKILITCCVVDTLEE
jgi:hypothetical protein